MISFVMVVGHILSDRTSQVAVTARDQSVQALELDGPNEALGMRVTVRSAGGRLANVHTGGAQERELPGRSIFDRDHKSVQRPDGEHHRRHRSAAA